MNVCKVCGSAPADKEATITETGGKIVLCERCYRDSQKQESQLLQDAADIVKDLLAEFPANDPATQQLKEKVAAIEKLARRVKEQESLR